MAVALAADAADLDAVAAVYAGRSLYYLAVAFGHAARHNELLYADDTRKSVRDAVAAVAAAKTFAKPGESYRLLRKQWAVTVDAVDALAGALPSAGLLIDRFVADAAVARDADEAAAVRPRCSPDSAGEPTR